MVDSVLLAGATGLVGGECLRLLAADSSIGRIAVLTRRPLTPPKRPAGPPVEAHAIDFDHLDDHAPLLQVDAILCALGTTIRTAGSRAAFRRVDYEYPLQLARLGRQQGARHFVLVSSLGADPRSRIFYSRVKGEVEEAIKAVGLPAVTILRPSLLLGDRGEFRLGEEIAKRLAWLVPGTYRPVRASQVARVMVEAVKAGGEGVRVVDSQVIRQVP